MRSGLVWFGSHGRATIPEIKSLMHALRANRLRTDINVVERVYHTAKEHHRGQVRKSGKPYIIHPVAVATIPAEMDMTTLTLVAALLHGTIKDTGCTLEQLAAEYGEVITNLVDGVTELDKVHYGATAQSKTLRKMFVAMSRDIRVLLIKFGDRLHNAHTWRFVPARLAAEKTKETLEIYAPLTHRLGINMVKQELEELSFKTLYPDIYEEIDRLVIGRAPQRGEYLRGVIDQVEEDLRRSGTRGAVSGHPEDHYSIYQKMIVRGKALDGAYDLVAVRVLVESIKDRYGVLGALHGRWNPIPDRFKDYVVMPKFNLYQSLHTMIIGPGGKPMEIQVRTFDMRERAEHGVAAHWRYKQNPGASSDDTNRMDSDEQTNWLRTLIEMEREAGDSEGFLGLLRSEIAGDKVYMLTPKDQIIVSPARSTPVGFAYAVHTEVGRRTVGAKVSGRLVSLDTRLESDGIVEAVTSKSDKSGPSCDWLAFVTSPHVRSKIKAQFSEECREEVVEVGEEALARAMRKQNLPLQHLTNHESILSTVTSFGYPDMSGLYAAAGESHASTQDVVSKLVGNLGGGGGIEGTLSEAVTPGSQKSRSEVSGDAAITAAGLSSNGIWVKLVKCCTPVPRNDIVGFITRGQSVSVHRSTCANTVRLGQLQPERLVDVSRNEKGLGTPLRVQIEVRAPGRGGLLSDLARVLSDYRVNTLAAALETDRDQVASGNFSFELTDFRHLNAVLPALRRVDGVFEAVRLDADS